jgi:hypothetical protein
VTRCGHALYFSETLGGATTMLLTMAPFADARHSVDGGLRWLYILAECELVLSVSFSLAD